jgi:hypothetical protein
VNRTPGTLQYYPDNCVEGLRKTTKIPSQDSWFPGRYLNKEHLDKDRVFLSIRTVVRSSKSMNLVAYGVIVAVHFILETTGRIFIKFGAYYLQFILWSNFIYVNVSCASFMTLQTKHVSSEKIWLLLMKRCRSDLYIQTFHVDIGIFNEFLQKLMVKKFLDTS